MKEKKSLYKGKYRYTYRYTVYGRAPYRKDYSWDIVGSRTTLKGAKDIGEKYASAGYTGIHIRKGRILCVLRRGEWIH